LKLFCGKSCIVRRSMSLKQLETRIEKIEERNYRVEADKAWETSWLRRVLIALLTYIVVWMYLVFVVNLPNPFINALVPTIGFLLSTLSIDLAKSFWMKYIYKS
jgi:uncharacterized membrane-anchored protein